MKMSSKNNIIELENINTIYEGENTPAIYNINFNVKYGDFISIIGPNGSGKTTLLETINGLLVYNSGLGYVFGKEIKKNKIKIRKDVGYVIQNFDIDPLAPFLCKDIVMSGRTGKIGLFKFATRNDWEQISKNMDIVGLNDFMDRPIGKLSGGEFQKILLARALSQEPKLLLLDEPFSNLDLTSRRKMEIILSKIHNEKNITIIMVSHDLSFIPSKCSRIIVLDKGKIIMDGKKDDILTSEIITKIFHKEDKII
jgi:ABC-type Mn2+/Zn2+ transport system ATPase subunit